MANICDVASSRISDLSVANVDTDVAFLAAEISAWYQELKDIYDKAFQLQVDFVRADKHFRSPEAAADAFVRGLLGDPLGTSNDAKAAERYFLERFEQHRRDLEKSNRDVIEINKRGDLLRIQLTNKYNLEFPDLH